MKLAQFEQRRHLYTFFFRLFDLTLPALVTQIVNHGHDDMLFNGIKEEVEARGFFI